MPVETYHVLCSDGVFVELPGQKVDLVTLCLLKERGNDRVAALHHAGKAPGLKQIQAPLGALGIRILVSLEM